MSDSPFGRPARLGSHDGPPPHATPAEHEEHFRAAFDQAAIGIAHAGLDGRWLAANRRWREILGYSQVDLDTGSLHDLLPADPSGAHPSLRQLLADHHAPYTQERPFTRKDGSTTWISLRLSLARTPAGKADFVICLLDELADAQQERAELLAQQEIARAASEASEQRYRLLIEAIPQMVWTARPDGYTDYFNQRWYDYTRMNVEQSLDWSWQLAIHPDDLERCLARWTGAIQTGQTYEIEYRLRRGSDGAYRWHLGRALPLRDRSGAIIKWFGTCTDIDDQKRAEAMIRDSQERLNLVVRATNDAIWDWDLITNEVTWNEATSRLFGYQGDTIHTTADWWREHIHPEDQERVYGGIHAVIDRGQQSWQDEYRFRRTDESYAFVLDRGYVIYNQAGLPARMIGAMTDLSKRRGAEALVSGQKRLLEMIALGAPLTDVLSALALLIEEQSSGALCAILLLHESGEYLTYGAAPSIPASYRQAVERIPVGENLGSCGSAVFLREQVIVTDIAGDPRWAGFADLALGHGLRACWSTPIMSSIGEVLGSFAMYYREPRGPTLDDQHLIEIATHISGIAIERTRTGDALQNALQRLTFHVENTPLGLIEWDQHFHALRWSQGAERIFGWQAHEVLGKSPSEWQFVHPEDDEVVAQVIAQMMGGVELRTVTTNRNFTKDGRVIYCVWYSSALLNSAGNPVSVLSLVEDVTARRQAEESLRFLAEASAILASSLDYEKTLATLAHLVVPSRADWCSIDMVVGDGIVRSLVVAHKDPAKVAVAQQVHQHYPYNPNAAYGIGRVMRTGKSDMLAEVTDEVFVTSARSPEHLARLRASGIISYMCVPLIARQRILGVLTFISSESGRRYTEADLALAEDLAQRAAIAVDNSRLYQESQEGILARDEFLSIASHELKTPITSLQLQAQSLIRNAKKGGLSSIGQERLLHKLDLITQQTERLTKLTNDLLDVARIRAGRIEMRLEEIDLTQAVREVVLRFEDQIEAAGCSLALDAEPGAMISADRIRLEQVVTNLLSNAIKYGAGQPIEIAVETTATSARLMIRDHGIGIAPDHLERIFVRFERAVSSRNYGGLGLGLYIARQIVESLGGSIQVTSELGVGSTFVVILPRASVTQPAVVDG
ncbi:MAG TPA: PAS domain S-box protein [Herpetosiphonaceae bacterium]